MTTSDVPTTDGRAAQPPAGWYPDPAAAGNQRYWDGRAWTGDVAPVAGAVAPAPAPAQPVIPVAAVTGRQREGLGGLVITGYVLAILIPVLGLVLGIAAAARHRGKPGPNHGAYVIAAAVFAMLVYVVIAVG